MVSFRMPVRVNAESQSAVCLGIVCLHLSVYIQQGRSVLASDMEAVIFRISPVVGVTVHATVELGVLDQGLFLIVGKTSFVDSHLAVHLVSGCQETIVDSVIDLVFRYVDGPGFVKYAAFYNDVSSFCCIQEPLPFLFLPDHFASLYGDAQISVSECGDWHGTVGCGVAEIQRRDSHRNGYVHVVRPYRAISISGLCRIKPVAGAQNQYSRQYVKQSFHHLNR